MIYRIWVLFTTISTLLLCSQVVKVKHMFEKEFPDVDFNQLDRSPLDETLKTLAETLFCIACPIIHIVFTVYLISNYDDLVQQTYEKTYPKLLNKINKMQGMYQPDDET